jgi:IgA Peptidase M64
MKQLPKLVLSAVAACCVMASSVSEGADPKPTVQQIVPSSGTGGPYLIAVLSDGFTEAEHQKFNTAADWVFNVQLFNDRFYKDHKDAFTVTTIFRPATRSGEAQYGISAFGDISNCYIATTGDVDSNVYDATATLTPPMLPTRTLIIANDVYSNGCTRNLWTYVWAGIQESSGVLEHELGHLAAGLLDEYSLNPGPFPAGGINGEGEPDGPNCSTLMFGKPPWKDLVVVTGDMPGTVEGCYYFAKRIYRAFAKCRMNTLNETFCAVCDDALSSALKELVAAPISMAPTDHRVIHAAFFQQPQAPSQSSVRLLVEIHSQNQQVTILRATDVPGPAAVRQRLIGTHAYEIRDGNDVTTGVLVGNPFQSRAYDGRGTGHPALPPSDTARVSIVVPRTTIQNLRMRGVEVAFYKLDPTPTRENITPARLNELKQQNLAHRIGALTPSDVSKSLQQLNPAAK